MGKSRGGSVQLLQIERYQGYTDEDTTQQIVHEAIWDEIHCKQYYLAEQTSI